MHIKWKIIQKKCCFDIAGWCRFSIKNAPFVFIKHKLSYIDHNALYIDRNVANIDCTASQCNADAHMVTDDIN